MPDRISLLLKLTAATLAALCLLQISRLSDSIPPLQSVQLPNLSILSTNTTTATNTPPDNPNTQIPTNVQNEIQIIQASQILGRLPQPQPIMLLGIAGQYAFLQTPSGASGLAAQGEEVGGVKVLSIGTNQVSIQFNNETQNLVLFPGLTTPQPNQP